MKKIILALATVGLLATTATAGGDHAKGGTEGAWFDFSCAMCSNLAEHDGLLENLGWDHYLITNGAVSVTTVPAGYEAAFATACEDMKATGQKMMAGEQMQVCNYCQSMGGIMMSGKMTMDEVVTPTGNILIMTSSDPETVKAIQVHTKRTMHELEKMAAAPTESR